MPSINRQRSLQSRISSLLAVGLMSAIGLGFLGWYYTGVYSRSTHTEGQGRSASKSRAQGDMPLPPLGRINPPAARAEQRTLERILGPAPELPDAQASAAWRETDELRRLRTSSSPVQKSPAEAAIDRRLGGSVFARVSESRPNAASSPSVVAPAPGPFAGLAFGPMTAPSVAARSEETGSLGELLQPSVTPAVEARVLPTREFLLGKGAAIDCTLETAIDSTLPGMTTCITATDTFGVDGRIVLLERGTKLVGETRGQVQQGASRLFVLWVEARTPTGVVVPLASPGTDELGRSGLAGSVNRHFWDRFGAAILISVINGAVQAASRTSRDGNSVVVNPTTSADVMTEVLKGTLSIRPTITKPQGDRIEVLVARDVDFRSVYALRNVSAPSGAGGTP